MQFRSPPRKVIAPPVCTLAYQHCGKTLHFASWCLGSSNTVPQIAACYRSFPRNSASLLTLSCGTTPTLVGAVCAANGTCPLHLRTPPMIRNRTQLDLTGVNGTSKNLGTTNSKRCGESDDLITGVYVNFGERFLCVYSRIFSVLVGALNGKLLGGYSVTLVTSPTPASSTTPFARKQNTTDVACRDSQDVVKKIFITGCLLLLATLSLAAHEVTEANTRGLFGFPPEYVHVLINPLPTYGLIVGIFALLAGLVLRSMASRDIGIVIIFFCTGITWAVIHYGQHAYNHIYHDLDAESQKWANIHMDRAESFGWVFYVTAVLSLISLFVPKFSTQPTNRQTTTTKETKAQPTATPPTQPTTAATPSPRPVPLRTRSPIGTAAATIVLVCAIISFALGTWISRAGGRIRHSEFREPSQLPAQSQAAEPEHHH
jgi:hypothetical protein